MGGWHTGLQVKGIQTTQGDPISKKKKKKLQHLNVKLTTKQTSVWCKHEVRHEEFTIIKTMKWCTMLDRWTEWSRKCIKVHAYTNKQPDTETTVTDCRLKTRWAYKRFRRYKQAQRQPPPELDSLSQAMTEKWTDSQCCPSAALWPPYTVRNTRASTYTNTRAR